MWTGTTTQKKAGYDKDGKDLHPHTNYNVGGNTKFYGAALFRLRKEDFGELKHHDGISPAWPISYEELEPYYTQAENLFHVHGNRGEDPTEPFSQRPVPVAGGNHEPRIQQLYRRFFALGLKPFHVPSECARRNQSTKEQMHSLWYVRRLSLSGLCQSRCASDLRG